MRKRILAVVTVAMCAMPMAKAQEALLAFDHSRVVEENYSNEMSTYNQIVYFDGKEVVSDKINCVCERPTENKLLIRLFQKFPANEGELWRETHLVVTIDLNLVADAYLYKFPGQEAIMDKYSIGYLNVNLSRFFINDLTEINSTMKFKLPAAFGYTGQDTLVHFRFRCSPGNVNQFGR